MRIEPQGGENRRYEIERQVVVAGTANDEKWGETKKVAPPFLRFHTPVRKRLYTNSHKLLESVEVRAAMTDSPPQSTCPGLSSVLGWELEKFS